MSIVMLGPQSSPPARVPRNPDRERRLVYGVGATHLVTFDAGGGRLRSQHYDSEKKASDCRFVSRSLLS